MSFSTFSCNQSSDSHPSTPQSPPHSSSPWSLCEGVVEGAIGSHTRVPSLWFEDGTVVFEAGSSLFKLHGSLLSLRSPVFGNILNWQDVPESSVSDMESGGIFEGYPVIKLTDDGQDAKYFFLAIYDSGFFERPPVPTSFDVLLAILKLSTKYEVAHLRKRAHFHLLLSYPLTLAQWDRRRNISTLAAELDVDAWPGSISKTLKVIEVAKSLDIPWILPAAFYDCSTVNLDMLLHDAKWNDGSMDGHTKNSILVGYQKQTSATHSQMLSFLYCEPLERCIQRDVCSEVRRKLYFASQEWTTTKPLEVMDDGDWDCFLGDLCELCLEISKVRFGQARREFWAGLPEIYGVPKWEVLIGLYEEALEDTQAMHWYSGD